MARGAKGWRRSQGEGHQNPDQGPELALSAATGQHRAVAFSLVYVGLCRVLALVVSFRRCDVDKDVELSCATRCVFWSASSIVGLGGLRAAVTSAAGRSATWPPSTFHRCGAASWF
jgi:hypothetical protein